MAGTPLGHNRAKNPICCSCCSPACKWMMHGCLPACMHPHDMTSAAVALRQTCCSLHKQNNSVALQAAHGSIAALLNQQYQDKPQPVNTLRRIWS